MSQGFFTAVDAMSDKEERDPFLETLESSGSDPSLLKNRPRSSWRTVLTVTPWLISACLGVWVLVLHSELNNGAAVFGSYESGFDTDISTYETELHVGGFQRLIQVAVPAAQIPMEQIRFRGSPQYDVNGTGFLNPVDKAAPWPENMELFGPPTPEIDSNWDQLIGNRYFSVSEAEAESAWGEKRHEYVDERKGGYTAG